MIKVLFVCLGNICRSPTADGVFRAMVESQRLHHRISVDSAGTHAYHVGSPPDARSQKAAKKRGYDLSALRARKVCPGDFEAFDYILAMDSENYANLIAKCPNQFQYKIQRFLECAPELLETEVPDPYYGSANGFDYVLDLVETASESLLRQIISEHHL